MGVAAGIIGASGYSGGELLRYLAWHPAIEVAVVTAATRAGRPVRGLLPHLPDAGLEFVPLEELDASGLDVVFSCIPTGPPTEAVGDARVIDLSDRYRADAAWTYGFPELFRAEITHATRVANPGCYPTASLLCLAPFARRGVIEGPVVIDALSGTSGAGRKGEDRLLHASLEGSASAYGAVDHRHVPEIESVLRTVTGHDVVVSFTPHLVPMARGLLVTARARLTQPLTDEDARAVLDDAYASEPFVTVIDGWPVTKGVAGTNRAVISARVDRRAGLLICSAAIDNLGKGAAGQAIQNANLMFGLEETTGLDAVGVWP